jgi:hypothetical protein
MDQPQRGRPKIYMDNTNISAQLKYYRKNRDQILEKRREKIKLKVKENKDKNNIIKDE